MATFPYLCLILNQLTIAGPSHDFFPSRWSARVIMYIVTVDRVYIHVDYQLWAMLLVPEYCNDESVNPHVFPALYEALIKGLIVKPPWITNTDSLSLFVLCLSIPCAVCTVKTNVLVKQIATVQLHLVPGNPLSLNYSLTR